VNSVKEYLGYGKLPDRGTALLGLKVAIQRTLFFFYRGFLIPPHPITNESRPKVERNDAIKQAVQEGSPISEIAKHFGISVQRIHQILHGKRK
jgi:Mor family transcriptional regulator